MTPTARPPATTTSALMPRACIVSATSSSGVSGAQAITPACMQSRTVSSGMGGHLHLQQLLISPPHGREVLLDHRLPALAEVAPQRPLDPGEQLGVRQPASLDEGRHPEEDADQDDALHPLHQVRLTRRLA